MTGQAINWRSWKPWAILTACCIEALTNAVGGYDLIGGADGGYKALFVLAGGVAVAALGAWVSTEAVKMWRRPGLAAVAGVMLVVGLGCFTLSQVVGWRVFSSSFVDGAFKREDKGQSFAKLQAERDGLGIVRPIAAIENDLSLELRSTSKQYPNGDGPKALKLKNELAGAKRAAELDTQIAAARKAGGAIKAGSENLIMSKVGLRNEQSIMLIVVLLMGLIGFFAYFGFAILELIEGADQAAVVADVEAFDPLLLPAPPMRRQIGPPGAAGASVGAPASGPRQPGGSGAANTINVYATDNNVRHLPPRLAARRAAG